MKKVEKLATNVQQGEYLGSTRPSYSSLGEGITQIIGSGSEGVSRFVIKLGKKVQALLFSSKSQRKLAFLPGYDIITCVFLLKVHLRYLVPLTL